MKALSTQKYTGDFWSEVAHTGGALGAAVWIWILPRVAVQAASARVRIKKGAWDRKMKQQAEEEKSIDEILRKIHEQGINSLTSKEKKTLADATKEAES